MVLRTANRDSNKMELVNVKIVVENIWPEKLIERHNDSLKMNVNSRMICVLQLVERWFCEKTFTVIQVNENRWAAEVQSVTNTTHANHIET